MQPFCFTSIARKMLIWEETRRACVWRGCGSWYRRPKATWRTEKRITTTAWPLIMPHALCMRFTVALAQQILKCWKVTCLLRFVVFSGSSSNRAKEKNHLLAVACLAFRPMRLFLAVQTNTECVLSNPWGPLENPIFFYLLDFERHLRENRFFSDQKWNIRAYISNNYIDKQTRIDWYERADTARISSDRLKDAR